MTPSTVVRNIKANMAYTGTSTSDMAKACKVSKSTWFNWMRNPEILTVPYLIIIASRLGTTPAELFEERRIKKA